MTLKSWLENDEAILIDVREPIEHIAEKISGSRLNPLAKLSKNSLPNFINKKLVLHCRSGKRSLIGCAKLISEDPNLEVYNLDGGMEAWKNCGNDSEYPVKSVMPIEQQVQITLGAIILIGSFFGYLVSSVFFIIPVFIGGGLCFAGLTGFCGLAKLLTKMPWNQKDLLGNSSLTKNN